MRCGREESLVPRSSCRRCSSVGRSTSGRPQYDGCPRQTDGAAQPVEAVGRTAIDPPTPQRCRNNENTFVRSEGSAEGERLACLNQAIQGKRRQTEKAKESRLPLAQPLPKRVGAAHFGQCRRNEQPCHSKKVHHLLLLASSLTAAAPAYHRERTLLPKVSMIPVLAQPASAVEMTTPTMPGEVASLWINHRSPCSAPHGSQALQRPIAIGATTHAIAAPNMNSGTSAVKRTRSSCSRAMSIASL